MTYPLLPYPTCPYYFLPHLQTEIASIREHVALMRSAIDKLSTGNERLESAVRSLGASRLSKLETTAIGERRAVGFADLTLGSNAGVFIRVKALSPLHRSGKPPISLVAVDAQGALGFVSANALTVSLAEAMIKSRSVIILDPELRSLASDDGTVRAVACAAAVEAHAFLNEGVPLRIQDAANAGKQVSSTII